MKFVPLDSLWAALLANGVCAGDVWVGGDGGGGHLDDGHVECGSVYIGFLENTIGM
jgi:hypothetical protein